VYCACHHVVEDGRSDALPARLGDYAASQAGPILLDLRLPRRRKSREVEQDGNGRH
jgi:hypothetical protein